MAEPEKRTPRQPRVPPRHPEETTKPLWSRLGYALDLGLTLEPARKTTKPSGIRLRPDDKIRAVALLRESDLFSQVGWTTAPRRTRPWWSHLVARRFLRSGPRT